MNTKIMIYYYNLLVDKVSNKVNNKLHEKSNVKHEDIFKICMKF